MRHAVVISYGLDDTAAGRLQARLRPRGVELRAVRHAKACLGAMRQGALGVLVLRIGKDLDRELTLLVQTTRLYPAMAPIVWGEAEHPHLGGLALDLGACAVFLSTQDEDRVHDVVLRLLPE